MEKSIEFITGRHQGENGDIPMSALNSLVELCKAKCKEFEACRSTCQEVLNLLKWMGVKT